MNESGSAGYQPDSQERTLAAACHASMLLVGFIGPLAIWLAKRDTSPLIDKNGREALNFSIAMFAYSCVCFVLVFVLVGIFLLYALGFFAIVVVIIASIKIYSGESYRYPFIFRLIHK